MKLKYGVTSFYDTNTGKPPRVKFETFKSLVYEVSHEISLKVIKIEEDGAAHNYYYACFISEENFALVCNAHYPIIAFVRNFEKPYFGAQLVSEEAPSISTIVEQGQYFTYIGEDTLRESLQPEHCLELAESEKIQIKKWDSKTLGEVIFNYYD